MRNRSRLFIGAASLVLAGGILLVVSFPRGAPRQARPPEPVGGIAEAPAEQAPAEPARPAARAEAPPAPARARSAQSRAPSKLPPVAPPTDPFIRIDSPADRAVYHSSVQVSGQVMDAAGSASSQEIDSVSWAIPGTDFDGIIPFSPDGTFSIRVPLVGLHGDIVLDVQAVSRNGRVTSISRRIRERTEGPVLEILSPADRSPLTDIVTIDGRVGDPSDPEGSASDVKALSWQAIGRPLLCGDVAFREDGWFSFTFPAKGLADDLVLELRAEDRNGHASVKAITLVRAPAQPAASPASSSAVAPQPAPSLTLTAPANGSFYRSSIQVSGRARSEGPGGRISMRWALAGTALAGTAAVEDDGAFSFAVPAAGLRGTQALRIMAAQGGAAAEITVVVYEDTRALSLAISAPADGGYYQAATIVEGSVGDESLPAFGELASLSWKIPARADLAGRAVVNADGGFKLALPFSDLSGDVTIAMVAEDRRGHLTQRTLTLHDGTKKPSLALSAPSDGSQFGSLIRAAGSVTDPYAGIPGMAGIRTLSWMVAPLDYSRHSTPVKGVTALGPDNSFRFSVPASGLQGPQQLTVTARAANGNESETTVRLVPGDGDVPGFVVDPGDGRVSVSWEEAPFAARYELTYRPAGRPAGGQRAINQASTPCVVTGLDNGSLYEFRLAVKFDDGGTGSSISLRAIPLAPETLAPVVTGDYQQIRLAWRPIPGASAYDVWRSLSRDSGYAAIASSLSAARYEDTAVEFGREYFYAISPSGLKAPRSAPGSGKTLAFPEDKLAFIGRAAVAAARRITINGGYAFVATGAGVTIVDVSDAKSPVVVGKVATRDAHHVAVRGDYAYVADGEAGLKVLDVSNPRAPEIIGSCKTSDARAVAVSGNHAFVADGAKGLKVIDISDARNPTRAAVLETADARDVAVSGDSLFLADGAGLSIFSLARPLFPSLLASLPAAEARSVAVHAGAAVLAGGSGGLHIVSVRDPARPSIASTFEAAIAASAATDGRFVYLVDESGSIKVIDIKDPGRPSLFTVHKTKGPVSVTVAGRYAYVAGSGRPGDPENPDLRPVLPGRLL